MKNKKEKILILTLGTGSIYGKSKKEREEQLHKMEESERKRQVMNDIKQKREERTFGYEPTKYQMPGTEVESPFIAEPLLKAVKPDIVYIIGSVKSAWTNFCSYFSETEDLEQLYDLFQIEFFNGIHTPADQLKNISKKITEIYTASLKKHGFEQKPKIHVLVTRYGINESELEENYQIIQEGLEEELEKGVSYEIAFDITHSFRSMPIYNLIILNYLKNVSQYDLKIAHTYYGNLESKCENGEIAQIVDLKEQIALLDLTNGVSEFRNTGNVVTLLAIMGEEKSELCNALRKFDWATQINDMGKVEEAIDELMEVSEAGNKSEQGKYRDLCQMMHQTLLEKIFIENGIAEVERFSDISIAERRYVLAKWYYEQKRYGIALATGLEALRSYLTPLYLCYKKMAVNDSNLEVENYRKASIDRISKIYKEFENKEEDADEIQKMFIRLEASRRNVVNIRNKFAHNLTGKQSVSNDMTEYDEENVESAQIQEFMETLSELRDMLKNNKNKVQKIYEKDEKMEKKYSGDNIRVLISNEDNCAYEKYRKSNKKKYELYGMPKEIRAFIKGNYPDDAVALLLSQVIENTFESLDGVTVVFADLNLKQIVNFAPILQKRGISHILYHKHLESGPLEVFPKIMWDLKEENYENYSFEKKGEEKMSNCLSVQCEKI